MSFLGNLFRLNMNSSATSSSDEETVLSEAKDKMAKKEIQDIINQSA